MDFRILGPLEVWDGARQVQVKGRLHPKVLAGLLLNNGRTVSLDWLVDLLWDDEPPATARRQAQNAVASLRRQFGDEHGDLIQRLGQGYRIEVTDDAIDLRRFETDARRGRRLADDERHEEALGSFDDALGWWRGPAFGDRPGRILLAAATRLDDARLSVIEDRAEVAVLLGRAETVIPELRDLVEGNPLRQRLTARLMMALDQQGERSEAVRCFDRLRDRLSEDVGIDPGPELMDLHSRLRRENLGLHQRPQLTGSTATPANPAQVKPAQLPADIATFTGRDEQIATLDRLLNTGSRVGIVSALTGIGGVGKTALAVHWGHSRKESFPDGQLYVNLRGFGEHEPLSPYEAVVRFLRTLEGSAANLPVTLDEATARYRSIVSERRMLILLDNAGSAEQVRPLLSGGTGCLILVTSRNRLSDLIALDDAYPVELDRLSPVESVNLLVNIIGPEALRDEANTRSIADSCAHLPLALRIAAARLIQDPNKTIAELAGELTTASRLRILRLGDDPYANVATVFEQSHAALETDARTVFSYLALIPGNDFSHGLAGAVSQLPETRLDRALESLVQAQLLEQRPSQRFGFHDLIRLYAGKRADSEISEPDRAGAVDRMIDWYHTHRNDPRLPEFDNLIAALQVHAKHPRVTKLAVAIQAVGDGGHDMRAIRTHLESALRNAETNREFDDQIRLLSVLGSTFSAEGDSDSAMELLREAKALLRHTNDLTLTGIIVGNLGTVLYGGSKYLEAEKYLLRAIAVAEHTGNMGHLATRLGNLGRVYRALGRYPEAETLISRSRKVSNAQSDNVSTNHTLLSLGLLYADMGKLQLAEATAQRVLDTARRLTTTRTEIQALLLSGEIAYRQHDTKTALGQLRLAAELAGGVGWSGYELDAHGMLAEVHAHARDHARALDHVTVMWELYTRTPRGGVEAQLCRTSCKVHLEAARFGEAMEFGQRAVRLYRHRNGPLRLGRSLESLGDACTGLGAAPDARTHWNEALEIFTRLGVPEAETVEAKLQALVR